MTAFNLLAIYEYTDALFRMHYHRFGNLSMYWRLYLRRTRQQVKHNTNHKQRCNIGKHAIIKCSYVTRHRRLKPHNVKEYATDNTNS